MVKIFGLDIPSGLEDLFFKIFQFGNNTTQTTIVGRTGFVTRAKKISWNTRSLFVRWASLYDGLTGGRHNAWTAYWISLPFSSHLGAGGWPGSGFSAFVYVNAPRLKAGLDLLLDPPTGVVLYEEFFDSGVGTWELTNVTFGSSHANFSPVGGYAQLNTPNGELPDLQQGDTIRFSGYISAGSGTLVVFLEGTHGPIEPLFDVFPGGYGFFQLEAVMITTYRDVGIVIFTEHGFGGYIDTLVVEKVA